MIAFYLKLIYKILMYPIQTAAAVIAFFKDHNLSKATQKYLQFHALRYQILWQKIQNTLEITQRMASSGSAKNKLQILDVGPGLFTELLSANLSKCYPDLEIHTLGLNPGYFELKSRPTFHQYDLNNLFLDPDSASVLVKALPKFDLILYCEVLEHLYTGPQDSLLFLQRLLKPKGKLIIQTPNAISLHHRLLMLVGKNPFPLLRPNSLEPGHFREYTAMELQKMLEKNCLKIEQIEFHNYFNYSGGFKNKFYKFITHFFPATFRDGITILAVKV